MRQTAKEGLPSSSRFRVVRLRKRFLNTFLGNAAAFELKFRMLVVADHRFHAGLAEGLGDPEAAAREAACFFSASRTA